MLNNEVRLKDLHSMVYERGLGDSQVRSEMTILCDLGFEQEVRDIVDCFEYDVFHGQVEGF
jgi:hypothetical protein